MYSIYKIKRKNRKIYKFFVLVLIIAGLGYSAFRYRQYIFFWKYTFSKIGQRLAEASNIDDPEKKKRKLLEVALICDEYNSRNQTSFETYLQSGKIHYKLGEILLNTNFSEFIISGCLDCIPQAARDEFQKAIKNIKKGIALLRSDDIDMEYLLMLAESCYYSNYYDQQEIYNLISRIREVELLKNVEDIRFLAVINILNKKEEYGIDILIKYGRTADNINGRFFLASAYNLAGKYTDSIMGYKYILENSTDNNLLKLANVNLGKLYFTQSLYNESLNHFTNALNLGNPDFSLKIWIGKTYSALGQKAKAKAVWQEVLAADQANDEVKKLLGLM